MKSSTVSRFRTAQGQLGNAFVICCFCAPLASFCQNWTLITTFTNPSPTAAAYFGRSVAAFGMDRVIIGTDQKVSAPVYLFSTNGVLLAALNDPNPQERDRFGTAIAALGTHAVLVGAFQYDTPMTDSGVAYLFDTNGTVITTFTNPYPATSSYFGWCVGRLGIERVLIG